MKKYQSFLSKKFQFLEVKFSLYLNRRVLVMLYWTLTRMLPLHETAFDDLRTIISRQTSKSLSHIYTSSEV